MKLDKKTIKICLYATIVIGILAHGYFYSSNAFSHDSLILYSADDQGQIQLGRFMMPVVRWLRGHYNVPWLLGMCTLVYAAIAAVLMCDLGGITNRIGIILISAIIVINPAVASQTATYISWLDIYMLGMLCAILSVWLTVKYKYGLWGGVIVAAISIGLYPAYIGAICVSCIVVLVNKLLNETNARLIDVLKKLATWFVQSACLVFIGLIIYVIILYVCIKYAWHTDLLNTYNGISNVGDYSNINIIQLLIDTYRYACNLFVNPLAAYPKVIRMCNMIAFCLAGFVGVAFIWKSQESKLVAVGEKAVLLLAVIVLPLAANAVFFISKGMIHTLMTAPCYLLYVFPVIFCSHYFDIRKNSEDESLKKRTLLLNKASSLIVYACLTVIIWDGIVFSNALYLKKRIEWDSTLSYVTRLTDRVESMEDYKSGETQVLVFGDCLNNTDYQGRWLRATGNTFNFAELVGASSNLAITYNITVASMLGLVAGDEMVVVFGGEEWEEMKQSEIVSNMPVFPDFGSTISYQGKVLVKLGQL